MKNKITITDIANIAQVSKATVSYYINGRLDKMSDKTAKKIKEAIEKTNFKPSYAARSLNSKNSQLIGIIIGNITNPFSNQFVKGIEDYANTKDYLTIVASSEFKPDRERTYIESMLSMGVDGFLIQPTIESSSYFKQKETNKPIVYFDSPSTLNNERYVKTNNYEAVYDATKILINKGYQHFILISSNPYVLQTRIERNKGCTDALNDSNISYDLIIIDNDIEVLKQRLYPIINNRKNVCIFAFNNSLLQLTYDALQPYIHRIPEIGLIGFDHEQWCECVRPTITTINQPAYQEGYTAGQILFDAIYKQNQVDKIQILNSTLVERESTNLKK